MQDRWHKGDILIQATPAPIKCKLRPRKAIDQTETIKCDLELNGPSLAIIHDI